MTQNFIAQGLELMLYGMGTVVVFLALLVVITTLMSRVVGRYFPEPLPPAPARPARGSARQTGSPDTETLAAITAAIRQYRNRKQ